VVLAPKTLISLQVREMVEFALRTGDLGATEISSALAARWRESADTNDCRRRAGPISKRGSADSRSDDADFTLRIQVGSMAC